MRRFRLEVVVFIVGAASLGTEIAAARLLAPYFGASTIVWANTIAVVLVALSAGYAVGGRIADRHPNWRALSLVVLSAGVLLACVPYVAPPFLRRAASALDTVSVGGFLGSLIGILVLVAVPVLLLGMVAPFALRLAQPAVEEAGRVSGRLYAISTVGSLVGTFVAALALVPFAGTRRTFLIFALVLVATGAIGLRRRLAVLAPVAVALLIALPNGQTKGSEEGRVIYETETPYQYASVIERPDGTRVLQLNEGQAVHSKLRPGSYLTGDYWDDPLVLGLLARPQPLRVAVLGNAAGSTARAYAHYFRDSRIDAVEIDGELTRIGRRFFDLDAPNIRTITADARPFLRRDGQRYDAIVVDAYRQPYIPFYLTTQQFFEEVRARLTRDGLVMVNAGHPPGSAQLEKVLAATAGSVFTHVVRDPARPTNTWVVATDAPLRPAQLAGAAASLPEDLQPLALAVAGRVGPALRGGEVYTDDRAPVEWLIDGSLAGYAVHDR